MPEEALPPGETLEFARALIVTGRPFGAHEVLEARWKAAPEIEREFWQGLAQLCVALTHGLRGNPAGARRLLDRAAARLMSSQGPDYGVDRAAAIAWVRSRLDDIPDGEAGVDEG